MTPPIHVALLHAYSARNSGDGLLVDLSVGLLREAFGDAVRDHAARRRVTRAAAE